MPCIFCEIVAGHVPSKKIYEDEKVIGILDIYPASIGHILLIPKQHYALFTEIPEETVGHLGVITSRLSRILVTNIKAQGVSTLLQQGTAAGQKSPHCVMHIIPRKDDDSLALSVQGKDLSQEEIEQGLAAMRIRENEEEGAEINHSDEQEEDSEDDIDTEEHEDTAEDEDKEDSTDFLDKIGDLV